MTLLELVVALSVLAILMLGVAATLSSGLSLVRQNRNRSVAANLASQEMDIVREAQFTSLAPLVTTVNVAGVNYTVNRELTWVAKSATNGPCDASNGSPQVLRVRVWVDWPARFGIPPASADTVLTPPVGAYDPNTGHVAVKVLGALADPEYGVSVQVNGPTSRSTITNSSGCAFFAFLPAGTYTVTLNMPSWVDRQGVANPTQNVSVVVGQVKSLQYDYDQASAITATFAAANGGAIPNDLPITVANTILVPTGTKPFTGTGNPRSLSNLFPAVDGYELWAGQCADADPEGKDASNVAFYPGATRDLPVAVTPGGTSTASVTLTPLRVRVTDQFGTPKANRTVRLVHAADNVCASGETHTIGVTNGSGIIDLSVPYGTWTIQEVGYAVSGSWPVVTLSPLDTIPRSTVTVAGMG